MSTKAAFSPDCERNREPIWAELKKLIKSDDGVLLEIGAGTGQHAAFMAPQLTGLLWYPTDTRDKLAGIERWRQQADCERIQSPRVFRVGDSDWPVESGQADIVYTANTFHIMPSELVAKLIQQAGENMTKEARFVVYGPFKYGGNFTSVSNRDFDGQLKATADHQGIRDFEWIDELFHHAGFRFLKDIAMPANNQFLAYVKTG
jgi:SAM-dependent methyltransferase